jgi:hypothetical protein
MRLMSHVVSLGRVAVDDVNKKINFLSILFVTTPTVLESESRRFR